MEEKHKTFHRKKTFAAFMICFAAFLGLAGRLVYLMVYSSAYYSEAADELHQRERSIKAKRGRILDAAGNVLADNRTVCTVSVIHNQITDPEAVVEVLSKELELEEAYVRERVEKYSSIERIRSNVDKETGDAIRAYQLDGVKVDEDYKRYYPFDSLASRVLGFTGADNQGIVGLEVKYEEYLEGEPGTILTVTDARGIEVDEEGESRLEPVDGDDLYISMDLNIQQYAAQLAEQVMAAKEAESVSILVMKPDNGEILAMVNVPEFNLNDPFTLPEGTETAGLSEEEKQDLLNQMWRNPCISDTYEPGSVFKTITAAAALEEGVVTMEDTFNCPGYVMVEDRRIRCHKTTGHGTQTFVEATMNSCNPVFVTVGLRLGAENYYRYFEQFNLLEKTGVDLPGEAGTIMHKVEDIGAVELATISFGQSFQVTPIRLAATISSLINGGNAVTPHFGVKTVDAQGNVTNRFEYPVEEGVVSEDTVEKLRYMLEQVVENGGGHNGYVEGYRVGGKTATSQTLPRGTGRYIASFMGFAPADDPKVLAMAIITNPQGTYYGGQVAAPVVRQLFENILPYLENLDYNVQRAEQ
ncbi:MAG TPA: peptidoglycan glycosyltransferase [Candidatus Eisenbergiella intestinigallinarum]|uniref:Peptidoglycan glycosyltransferase n=1 Tax=Candidatus Eisenbergiella intestinigallinarum TaxID=2838549 RepID=A0A9D2TQ41_9FIRM|nr:peptidoglycan glycosyltransferase [Candidatus Eisenbergiella intestinigallinarum]